REPIGAGSQFNAPGSSLVIPVIRFALIDIVPLAARRGGELLRICNILFATAVCVTYAFALAAVVPTPLGCPKSVRILDNHRICPQGVLVVTCKTKTFGLAALGLLLAFALLTPSALAAQTGAERLGYPAGKKVLILYIDQVGLTDETNAAAEKLLASEPAKSVGVMMPAPWSLDFIHRNKKSDQHDVGLSLTLTSEYPNYRWK